MNSSLLVHAMVTIKGLLPNEKNVLKTAELDIVLIVDKSSSMEGSRMKTMKNLILYLINSILKENHRLGN
jgi:Mg-chelatase subunit ChlD